MKGHTSRLYSLLSLPNGDLASASADKKIRIWNLNSGECKIILTGHIEYVCSLALLPNGDLASGSNDGTIKIWNTTNGTVKMALQSCDSIVSLATLKNGQLAAGHIIYMNNFGASYSAFIAENVITIWN